MDMFTIENKRVLITGSSQGLGFGFAEGLGLTGAEIILNRRSHFPVIQRIRFYYGADHLC